jgi:uncharacterized membrane protein
MSQHKHAASEDIFHNRKEFQIERLILFSDAVFAIAITLLVIEIKVPVLKEFTTHAVAEAMSEKFSEFFGFVLSFAVIGQFWVNHHRMFGFVTGYNNSLLWLNLHMLFWVVMVPFTSGLNSHYGGLDIIWMIYSLNLCMIALSIFFIFKYIGNPKRNLSTIAHQTVLKKYSYVRSLTTAFIFFLGFVLCLFHFDIASWTARFIFILIPFALSFINKKASAAAALPAHQKK